MPKQQLHVILTKSADLLPQRHVLLQLLKYILTMLTQSLINRWAILKQQLQFTLAKLRQSVTHRLAVRLFVPQHLIPLPRRHTVYGIN